MWTDYHAQRSATPLRPYSDDSATELFGQMVPMNYSSNDLVKTSLQDSSLKNSK